MARYAYQAHYGILKLIELHKANKDYRIVFDFLDDIIVLDSSSSPSEMDLYQLKTKAKGQWTAAQLCRRGKKGDLPRSYVGRMYYPLQSLSSYVSSVSFVSNAAFDVQLTSGSKSGASDVKINGSELADSEIDLFDAAIDADYPGSTRLPYRDRFYLEQCSMGLGDQDAMVIGHLTKFFSSVTSVDDPPAEALYATLINKVIALTGNSSTSFPDEISFRQRKTIGKDEIDALVTAVSSRRGFLSNWSLVEHDLISAGKPTREIIRLKSGATRYLGWKASGDVNATSFAREAAVCASGNAAVAKMQTVSEVAHYLDAQVAYSCPTWTAIERLGACLVEGYEALNG